MTMTYVCSLCKKQGFLEMKMIPDCRHSFCAGCVEAQKVVIGGKCPVPNPDVRNSYCNGNIDNFISIVVPTGLEDIKKGIDTELETIEFEKELLKNVKDGIVSFTRNLITSSSQLIERNVRCLQSDQQEKIELLRRGKVIADDKVENLQKIVNHAEDIKKGKANKKAGELEMLQKEILEFPAVEYSVNTESYKNASNISDVKGEIKIHPVLYCEFTGAVNKQEDVVMGADVFFPATYLPCSYLTTHLVPPFMEYFFIIPDFFKSAVYPKSVSSPVFQTLPFPFKWKFTVYPNGGPKVGKVQEFVSVVVELVNGFEPVVVEAFQTLFPEYKTEKFPDYTAAASTSSSSSSSSSTPADPLAIGPESIQAIMRNPFVFDFKVQMIAQTPNPDASKRIYSFESTANFEKKDPNKQGKAEFVQKKVVNSGYVWNDERFPNSVHFVFGIRFPSFKREYEALRVAYFLEKKK